MKPINRSEFFSLTVHQRRVAIAEDIILRVKSGSFNGSHGIFIKSPVTDRAMLDDIAPSQVKGATCEVCAKGAIACSWFINLNKHNLRDFGLSPNYETDAMKELTQTFGPKLWSTIEAVFECFCPSSYEDVDAVNFNEDEANHIRNYANRLQYKLTVNEKLIAIFNNIIKNEGNFLIPIPKKKGFLVS